MSRCVLTDNAQEHTFASDNSVEEKFDWTVDADAVLRDIKFLLKEYYVATFSFDGQSLDVSFNNGQKFQISVKEIK